jgi:hypothetical protein
MNIHEVVLKRNSFYEHLVVSQVILMGLLLLGLLVNFYFFRAIYFDQVKPTYFITTASGVSLQDIPVSQPIYSDEEIESWVTSKIADIFSFNFYNYKRHLSTISNDFDQIGFVEFNNALEQNRLLLAIIRHRFLSRVSVVKPFKVRKHQPINGAFGWILDGELLVEYVNKQNALNPYTQKMQMIVLVTRQSLFMYPQGVAFRTIVAQ